MDVFTSGQAVDLIKCELLRTAADHRFEVPAYCFMPDHFHGLFESLACDCQFTKFVNMFKQRSAFRYGRSHCRRLWQEGYFDRVLRDTESTLDVVAYILANPVRAGLCDEPRAYPHVGSSVYAIEDLCEAVGGRRR